MYIRAHIIDYMYTKTMKFPHFIIAITLCVLRQAISLSTNRQWKLSKSSTLRNARNTSHLSRKSLKVFMEQENDDVNNGLMDRRSVHGTLSAALGVVTASMIAPLESRAAVGSIPEFANTNAVMQGVTINVAENKQLLDMVNFLREGMNFKVLRQAAKGSVTSVWLGFGPEQMSIPSDFELPVSAFSEYGGHASIEVRFDPKTTTSYYDGTTMGGNNIAYLQVGVPSYRISQMSNFGGNIIDAYGFVNVVSPSGLPMRGIVGVAPDPIMFLAVYATDIKRSQSFYEALGMAEQEYPYARLNKGAGQFEPPQPKNSVYLAHSPNSMGILILPTEKKKQKIIANPAFSSVNIVYNPTNQSDETAIWNLEAVDPSSVPISFIPYSRFESEEVSGTVAAKAALDK